MSTWIKRTRALPGFRTTATERQEADGPSGRHPHRTREIRLGSAREPHNTQTSRTQGGTWARSWSSAPQAREGLPSQGGTPGRGPVPGRADRPAGGRSAGAGTGSGPGRGEPAAGSALGHGVADSGGPGGVAAGGFRPSSQDDLAPSGAVSRARANLAALTTLRAIEREARPATPDEQQVLARWSGWGAVPEVLDTRRPEYAWAREQLGALLGPQEMAAAARNTLNAHYTGAGIVQAAWSAVCRRSASPAGGCWSRAAAAATSSVSPRADLGSTHRPRLVHRVRGGRT